MSHPVTKAPIPASFTAKAAGILRDITIAIGVAPTPAVPIASNLQHFHSTTALWDTGATNSCITADLAASIGAVPIGKTIVHGAHGPGQMNVYMIDFMLPNQVRITDIRATEVVSTAGGFGVIVGMDIITLGDFCITNVDGKTVVTYRIPSLKVIDFGDASSAINYPDNAVILPSVASGQGRNAKCSCGSGKKAKQCCGK
jgi:hypothetical protein